MRLVWLALGLLAVGLGLLGVFLPLLPTTPFMILAAACFAKSSPRLHGWLLAHRVFGPMIINWRAHRAIPRRAKYAALAAMAAAFGLSLALALPPMVLAAQGAVLLVTGSWIATRAEGPAASPAPPARRIGHTAPEMHPPGPEPHVAPAAGIGYESPTLPDPCNGDCPETPPATRAK